MKKNILFILSLFSLTFLNAQSLSFEWAKRMGSSNFDQGFTVAADAAGNVYTGGLFQGTVDFDPGPAVYTLTANAMDGFITKFDAAGNFIWAIQIGGSQADAVYNFLVDNAGNLMVTGDFRGTVDFDPGPGTYNLTGVSGGAGDNDTYILKLTSAGSFVWALSLSGMGTDYIYVMTLDASNNVYVTGSYENTVDFDPGAPTYTLQAAGMYDGFVAKYDAAGSFVWAKSLGSSGTDLGVHVVLDPSGNVYAEGYFEGTVDFDPGAGVANLTASSSGDTWVLKLDNAGNFIWVKQMGQTTNSLALDATGNIYLAGAFSGTEDFDPGVGQATLTSTAGFDAFLVKWDASGNFIWAKQMGGGLNDEYRNIVFDASGNLYVTGAFAATADLNPGTATYMVTSAGSKDSFIEKLDAAGNFIFVKVFGGNALDYIYDIRIDAANNLYMAGVFGGTVDFDPGIGVFNLVAAGSGGQSDAFVCKLSSCIPSPAPANATAPGNQNVCLTSNAPKTTTLAVNASPTGTITWYSSPTSTTALGTGSTFITPPLVTGTFTYYALERSSCEDTLRRTAIVVMAGSCAGLQGYGDLVTGFRAYPNPVSGSLHISLNQPAGSKSMKLVVFNALGQLVLEAPLEGQEMILDLEPLPAGVYIASLVSDNKTITTQKIVRQ